MPERRDPTTRFKQHELGRCDRCLNGKRCSHSLQPRQEDYFTHWLRLNCTLQAALGVWFNQTIISRYKIITFSICLTWTGSVRLANHIHHFSFITNKCSEMGRLWWVIHLRGPIDPCRRALNFRWDWILEQTCNSTQYNLYSWESVREQYILQRFCIRHNIGTKCPRLDLAPRGKVHVATYYILSLPSWITLYTPLTD